MDDWNGRTAGGIEIPVAHRDSVQGKNRIFYVIACGPKVKLVQPGDRVLSYTYSSGMVPLEDGLGRGFLKESECMAVVPS